MRKKRESNTESLGDVIKEFLKKNNLEQGYDAQRIMSIWSEMLGSVIAGKTKGIYLNGSILHVELESSVIRNELSFAKEKLVKEINEKLGKELITEIKLK